MLQSTLIEFERKLNILVATFMLWIICCNWNVVPSPLTTLPFLFLSEWSEWYKGHFTCIINVYNVWDHKEQARNAEYRRGYSWINRDLKIVRSLKNKKYTGKVNNVIHLLPPSAANLPSLISVQRLTGTLSSNKTPFSWGVNVNRLGHILLYLSPRPNAYKPIHM